MADDDKGGSEKRRQEPPPLEFLKPGEPQTPAPTQQTPAAWVTRPEDFQQPAYPQGPAPPRARAASPGRLAQIGGLSLLVAGLISIGYILGTSLTPLTPTQYANVSSDSSLYAFLQICGAFVTWSQVVALLSGVMAFQKMSWRFTSGCAFFAMAGLAGYAALFGDLYGLPSALLSMVGFILIIMARREFVS
jgi:hypothetical protein